MNTSNIYSEYTKWKQNPSTSFKRGKIVYISQSSVAIIPNEDPLTIIKFLNPKAVPYGMSIEEEFNMLKMLEPLKGENFIIPIPISWGKNPRHIHMSLVGKAISHNEHLSNEEIKAIGQAVGEFASYLYADFKLIHSDICRNNLTHGPDRKTGIIDFASIEDDVPEKMFVAPLFDKDLAIVPYMAHEFEARTGIKIDFDTVEAMHEERIQLFLGQNRRNPRCSETEAYQIADTSRETREKWRQSSAEQRNMADRPETVRSTPTAQACQNNLSKT